jgi:acyl-CoA synthetase (NDP forming)
MSLSAARRTLEKAGRSAAAAGTWLVPGRRTVMQKITDAASEFLANKRVAVTGEVYTVNPNADEVEGDRCYPDLGSIPDGVDAVVIATRPEAAEATMRECAQLGIRHVWMHRGPGTEASRRRQPTTDGSRASP